MLSIKTLRSILLMTAIALGSIGATSARAADEAPAKPVVPTDTPARGPQGQLDRFKTAVYALKVTDEQKAKLDPLFESAQTDLKSAQGETNEKVKAGKTRQLFAKLRADAGAILTNEQKLELRKAMAPPGPGAVIDRIKDQLNKPELKLTDDQKTKADQVLDDTKARLEALMAQVKSGGKDAASEAGPKAKDILAEMQRKLTEILSPDQQAHLNGAPPAKSGAGN